MGTKAQLITNLNSFITALGKVTKVRHTGANTQLVNELYQTTHTMQIADANGILSYKINFKKIGNIVFVDGYFWNRTGVVITTVLDLLTIDNSLYFAKYAVFVNITNVTTFSIGGIVIFDDTISLPSSLGNGSKVSFNASYQTND